MSYEFLQNYWWVLIALLGGLLVGTELHVCAFGFLDGLAAFGWASLSY